MSKLSYGLKKSGTIFETPFLIRQTESHLVFGPISRHFAFGYVVLVVASVSLVMLFFAGHVSLGEFIASLVDKLFYLLIPVIILMLTLRQQAIVGWVAVKVAFGSAAFIMATVGSTVSFQNGRSDAWVLLFLGLIWIPSIEFIPKITPYQRYVTLGRIALSIPCVYVGLKSGNWHW